MTWVSFITICALSFLLSLFMCLSACPSFSLSLYFCLYLSFCVLFFLSLCLSNSVFFSLLASLSLFSLLIINATYMLSHTCQQHPFIVPYCEASLWQEICIRRGDEKLISTWQKTCYRWKFSSTQSYYREITLNHWQNTYLYMSLLMRTKTQTDDVCKHFQIWVKDGQNGSRHSSVDPSAPTILRLEVQIPSATNTLCFFQFKFEF